MLISYQQQTRRLLNDQRFALFNDFDLRDYVNQARRQIALDLQVLRQPADLATIVNQASYLFSAATYVAAPDMPAGLGAIVLVRSASIAVLNGFQRLEVRPWEWFESYELDRVGVVTDTPKMMAQQRLGAGSGTLWFAPTPDDIYTIRLYAVCLPIDLVNDTTSEALPAPWQDVVPYYAATIAFLSVGNNDAATSMWSRYQNFQNRSATQVTGTQLSQNFPVFRMMEQGDPSGNMPSGRG